MNLRSARSRFVADDVLTFDVTPSRENAAVANVTFYAPLLEHLRRCRM